jgi:serine/threonine protein kinase
MSWINSRQFTIADRNGRHYVFRRNNAGNTEINIPAHIVSKGQAITWLKANPDKVANPTRFKPKRGAPRKNATGLRPFERMVNGKKMLVFVNKEGRQTLRPAPPPLPKKKASPYKYVPPPPPPPPPGGWRYPAPKLVPWKKRQIAPPKNDWASLTCDQLKSSLDSVDPIGKGRQGIVFAAHLSTGNKQPFAVKVAPRDLAASKRGEPQPVDVEFRIQDAVQNSTPNVVRVYKNVRCENFITPAQMNMPNVQNSTRFDKSKQGILLMEFATGGSLDSWLKKKAHVTDAMMAHIISDILGALYKIQAKYPDFRHNDLHMQNVFVADRGFLIGDFGWARLKKSGTNPAVNTANGTKTASFWGVGPKTDERYDHHLFLNELLEWAQKHSPGDHPQAIEFLKKAVPSGYRGVKDVHVSEWRLKYEDPCRGLPSLAEVLSYPFLTGKKRVTSLNLKAAKAGLEPVKVKRVFSANLVKAKAALKAKNLRKPVRLITSLQLRKAKAALKAVPRPKPKPRITGYNLRAAKAKLKVVARPRLPSPLSPLSPPKKKVVLPKGILKTAKFNKLVEKLWKNAGAASGANFQNAWNASRIKAIAVLENRLRRNLSAFTPSPPKPKAASPPKPKPKAASPPKPKARPNFKLSPTSGRAKIQSKNSGRWVYANLHYSMDELKNLAARLSVNVKGLRSKANIAKKLFG